MTTSQEVRFSTITRTRLQAHGPEEQKRVLLKLYKSNAAALGRGFEFCKRHQIPLFRMSSDLFPFSDTELGQDVLLSLRADLATLGTSAQGLRLVMHPDQYVVLNSERPEVIDNARRVLGMHGLILDLLGQPRSPGAAIIIHGGKRGRGKELAAEIRRLPDRERSRLVLENDEAAYGAAEISEICSQSGVPMVFDAHHHVVHEKLTSYEDRSIGMALAEAAKTWEQRSLQLTHISNGRESFGDRRHSDYITTLPSCYTDAPWIEVEAKAKELAIFALRQRC